MRNWLIGLMGLAWVLWTIMFAPPLASHVPFWVAMPISGILLVLISSLYDRSWLKLLRFGLTDVLMGIGIALLLWGCFYIGNAVARVMFNFSEQQIGAIYALKEGMNPWLLSGLLLCIIGPAEEIFWRGIVQRHLAARMGPTGAYVVATAVYALVHVAAMNVMLILAALVAGIVWGGLYRLFPNRLGALVLSHALWDAAVFVWFPIG